MAAEGISSRISRLNQLLLGKTPGRKVPLLDKETLLDAFTVLFNECNTESMMEDKNISTYIKKFKPLISELEKLRLKKADFEIRKTIGRGHFGEVHVVREKVTGNVYAMKVLKKTSTLAQDNVAFFEEERDIMAFANNPWITSLQYAFQDRESLYFVMDFHPGGDLLSLLAKYDDVFEEEVSRFYLAEMIMAIHAVHALGYVHRDVKPENVLIDRLGHVKLADFGSSARLSSAKTVVSKMPVGTPEYIAPEVLMSMDGGSSGGKYGIECDWWSLGVVAYEMMIGVTPFQADSVVVVYSNIMNFKNSLVFPDDEPLTDNAKSVIRSLLTDQDSRITYVELAKHPFFSGLDWTTLQNDFPPYVPNIQREDDTSNFDDFEPEPTSGPRLEDFMEQKKGFVGSDLPFIGFSFTKQLTLASLTETGDDAVSGHGTLTRGDSGTINRGKSIKRDSVKDNSSLQLANLKTEFEKEQKKNKELKLQIEEKMKNLSKLTQEYDSLESEKKLFDTERQDLERRVNTEKTNREKLEKELSTMRKEMEENSTKATGTDHLKSRCDEQEQQIEQLEHDKSTLTRNSQHLETTLNDHKQLLSDATTRNNELQAKLNRANKDHNNKVSELQQNMHQLTTDNESRIKHIQDKLNKETAALQEVNEKLRSVEKEKEEMQGKVVELKTFEELYKQQQAEKTSVEANGEIENLQKELTEKRAECKKLDKDVKKVTTELDEANTKYDNLVEFGEDLKAQVERKMEKLQKELASSKKEKTKLSEENEKAKTLLDESKTTISQQEMTIATLKASCSSFEEQLSSFINNKKEPSDECETIIVEASGAQEERFHMTRQMSELSSEKFKLETQLTRITAEVEQSQKEKETLKESLEEVQKQLEEANETSESTISKLNREISKSSEENAKAQRELAVSRTSYEELEVKFTLLQEESEKTVGTADKIKELESELRISNVNVENLKADKKGLETKYQQSYEELNKLRKDKQLVQDELSEKERQTSNHEMTIHMLKQTCTMLEGQVEELEVMNDEYIDRESQWNMMKRQQYQAQERLEQQYNENLSLLEQQRIQKNKAEEKLREFEENMSSSRYNNDKQQEEIEKLTLVHEDNMKELNASLSTLAKKDGLNQVTIKNLEKKLITSTEDKDRLLSEVSHLQELSSQQSTSNFELTLKIDTLKEQLDETETERESLQNQMERTAFSHAEEKIKQDATLAQQTKLIDYLQMKVMSDNKDFHPGKKKFTFGGKGNKQQENNAAAQTVDVRKTRDLEKAIEKEKNNALQLHLQLQNARNELTNLRNENAQLKTQLKTASTPTTPQPHLKQANNMLKTPSTGSVISNLSVNRPNESPPTSVADIYQMAENEVRGNEPKHFEIPPDDDSPHNMQTTLNMRSGKCPVCLNCVAFATKVMKCTECGLICHPTCTQSLRNTCGVIPETNGVHHRSSLIAEDGSLSGDEDGTFKLPKIEGWLKYPRKNGNKQNWERKWVVLQDMKLSIYENENTIEFDPFDEIGDLNINEGELNIHPSIPASELIWSTSSDIQYVFSIELLPYTLGWPRRTLYFLAPTFADKQKWVASLELIGDEVKKSTQRNGHGMAENVILTLAEKQLEVNCAALLNDTGAILGCDDGLYVVSFKPGSHHNKPVHIVGLGAVYQLQIVRDLGIAVLIVGKERELCYIDVYDLESRLKQLQSGASISAITAQQIEKVKACHIFIVQKIDNDYYACAATNRKLSILKFLPNTQNFSLKKEVETTEPATCLLLTSQSAIFGTSKFFTVDLKNYQKRELLERSDTSLAFAVFGSSQTHSFPVAVFNIGEGRTRDEYLLCYNQFGIFVDWQGRRSRKEDLKWSRLPLAFDYRAPHLYISHFSSIEICEIPGDTKSEISNIHRRFVDVPDPRFVGTGLQSRIVLFSSTQKSKLELISYQATVSLNPLSRHSSTASAMSLASSMSSSSGFDSVPGTIREHPAVSDIIERTYSKDSICSDEETSMAIATHKDNKRNNRKDQLRAQDKDKNRISFRFFKQKDNRKSQNLDGQ